MAPQKATSLAVELAGHLAMGACLGTLLAMTLLISNTANVFDMIRHTAAPSTTIAVFVGVFASLCGIGATLTGWIFTTLDRS